VNKNISQGQSLFEVVVAIGIVSAILVGVMSLATHSISNSTFSREQALAQTYTQEAVEWLRGERDMNWDTFSANSSGTGQTWCLSALSWGNAGSCSPSEVISGTNFAREATLTMVNQDEIHVLVSTSWEGKGGQHEARIQTKLNNWKAK